MTATHSHPDRPSPLRGLAPGAALGALGGIYVGAVELGSAWALRVTWSVESPVLNLVVYAAALGIVGALLGPAVLLAARLPIVRGLDAWALLASALGLLGWGVRSAMVIALRPKDAPGGPVLCLALALVGGAVLALVLARVLRGRAGRPGETFGLGAAVALPTLAGAVLVQVLCLGGRVDLGPGPALVGGQLAVAGLAFLAPLLLGAHARLETGAHARLETGAHARLETGAHARLETGAHARLETGARARLATGALLVSAVLLALGLERFDGARGRGSTAPGSAPNVLLLVLDTLRLDAVSAYGFVEGTTPELDELAAQGTLWETAISPSNWTVPGHASLFTGAQVSRHGCDTRREVLRAVPGGAGTPPLPTIAELLSQDGWSTAAFVCNSNLIGARGFDRGFDEYHEIWLIRDGFFDALHHLRAALGPGRFDKGGAWTVDGLERWMRARESEERPWFCFVNFMEPHDPYDAPLPWLHAYVDAADADITRREARELSQAARAYKYGGAPAELSARLYALYLGCVAYQDHLVGRVLDALEELELADDTIVIVTSDHGEDFGWDQRLFHGVGMSDGVLGVPLLARGPGVPAGARETTPASLIDVLPTVLHLLDRPAPPAPGGIGVVLPPIGPPLAGDRPLLAERTDFFLTDVAEALALRPDVPIEATFGRQAWMQGPWKAVRVNEHGETLELSLRRPAPPFDEGRDPVDDPARLLELLEALDRHRTSWPHALDPAPGEIPPLDEATLDELRKLGYVD